MSGSVRKAAGGTGASPMPKAPRSDEEMIEVEYEGEKQPQTRTEAKQGMDERQTDAQEYDVNDDGG